MFVDLRKQKDLRNSWWTRWLKSKTRLSTWCQSVAKVEHFPFNFFLGVLSSDILIFQTWVLWKSREIQWQNVNHLLSLPFLDVHQDDKKIIYICTHQLCTPLHSLSASGCRCCLWSLDEIVKGCVGEGWGIGGGSTFEIGQSLNAHLGEMEWNTYKKKLTAKNIYVFCSMKWTSKPKNSDNSVTFTWIAFMDFPPKMWTCGRCHVVNILFDRGKCSVLLTETVHWELVARLQPLLPFSSRLIGGVWGRIRKLQRKILWRSFDAKRTYRNWAVTKTLVGWGI